MKKSIYLVLSAFMAASVFTGCGAAIENPGITKRTMVTESSVADVTSSQEQDKTEPEDTLISFAGVGDNLIHETVYLDADKYSGEMNDDKYDFSPMYEEIKEYIQGKDIAFVNQETVIGGQELGVSGYPAFNAPSELVQNLKDVGFNLVNTATNHSLDKGQEAIDNQIASLNAVGDMIFGGTGDSRETYDNIPVFEKAGIKFSFLAYTYGTNGITAPNDYSVHYLDDQQITADVAKAKEISDVVIVSAHWGEENIDYATDTQQHYAQLFADLEVDVVIGTHPHVIQPIEWVEGKNGNKTLVVYSLGNFLGGMLSVDNTLSGIVTFDFLQHDGDITIENVKWIPLVIHFETDGGDISEDRHSYKIYPLSEYTDELASKHALNGYEGQTVTVDYYNQHTKDVIGEEYL